MKFFTNLLKSVIFLFKNKRKIKNLLFKIQKLLILVLNKKHDILKTQAVEFLIYNLRV